jgi:hypothetical protein
MLSVAIDGATGTDPILFVRSGDCQAGTEVACTDSIGANTIESAEFLAKAGETYHVFVDSYGKASGDFVMTAQLIPLAPNDTCATAQAVPVAPGPTTVLQGTTATATHDTTPNKCGGSGKGRDVFYQVTPSKPGNLRIKLTAGFDTVLYAYQTACGVAANEIACKDSVGVSPEEVSIPVVADQPVWVAVDSYATAASGAFSLELELTEAPANDDCATAQAVDVPAGKSSVSGTTTAATHQYTGSCGGSSKAEDVVYQLTPQVAGKLTVKLTATYDSVLYGWSGSCGTSGKTLGCDDAVGVSTPETLSFPVLPGQSYWMVVDGYSLADGPFSLAFDLVPAPDNDTCAAPTAVSLMTGEKVTLTGDSTGAASDYATLCSSAIGPDAAYVVTPASSGKLIISLSADTSGYDPILYAGTGACATGPLSGSCKDSSGGGGTETLTIASAVAGTSYWVMADAYKAAGGPYHISFELQLGDSEE